MTKIRRMIAATALACGLAGAATMINVPTAAAVTRGVMVYGETYTGCRVELNRLHVLYKSAGYDIAHISYCSENTATPAGWNNYTGSLHWHVKPFG